MVITRSARIVRKAVTPAPLAKPVLLVLLVSSSTTRTATILIARMDNTSTITHSNANPANLAVHNAHQPQTALSAPPDCSFRTATVTTQLAHLAYSSTQPAATVQTVQLDAASAQIVILAPTAPVVTSSTQTESV